MEAPTDAALAECDKIAEILRTFLAEAPIGDEYGTLTEAEWRLGNAFLDYLSAKGIAAFHDRTPT